MGKINEVKLELRYRAWSEQIQECQQSGMSIRKWCAANNVNVNTFNSRLKKIRELAIERCPELQKIVPVSISENIIAETSSNDIVPAVGAETAKVINDKPEKIFIRKNDIEIELSDRTSETVILTLMRGLGLC